MRVTNNNLKLRDFKAWSGAKDTQEKIIEENKAEEFDSLIERFYPDGLTETELNDMLWFNDDWIFEQLEITEEEELGELK